MGTLELEGEEKKLAKHKQKGCLCYKNPSPSFYIFFFPFPLSFILSIPLSLLFVGRQAC
jgi:hypothetical protein